MDPTCVDDFALALVLRRADDDAVRVARTVNKQWRAVATEELHRRLISRPSSFRRTAYRYALSTRAAVSTVNMLRQSNILDRLSPPRVLQRACKYGSVDVARWLATQYTISPEDVCPASLIYACEGGYEELARWLVERFNMPPIDRQCLRSVCKNGHLSVLKWQIREYDNEKHTRLWTRSSYVMLAVCAGASLSVVQWLMNAREAEYNGAARPPKAYMLRQACHGGSLSVLKCVIQYYNCTRGDIVTSYTDIMYAACAANSLEIAKWLDGLYGLPMDDVFTQNEFSIFYDACSPGCAETVRWLLQKFRQAGLAPRGHKNFRAIAKACADGNLMVARMLSDGLGLRLAVVGGMLFDQALISAAGVDYDTVAWMLDEASRAIDTDMRHLTVCCKAVGRACGCNRLDIARLIAGRVDIPRGHMINVLARLGTFELICERNNTHVLQWLLHDEELTDRRYLIEKMFTVACLRGSKDVAVWLRDAYKITDDEIRGYTLTTNIRSLDVVLWLTEDLSVDIDPQLAFSLVCNTGVVSAIKRYDSMFESAGGAHVRDARQIIRNVCIGGGAAGSTETLQFLMDKYPHIKKEKSYASKRVKGRP